MKCNTAVVLLLFLIVQVIYCNFPLDDFQLTQQYRHNTRDINNNAVTDHAESVAGGNLFYARRIATYKTPQYSDYEEVSIGSGSTTATTDVFTVGDHVFYEYFYNTDPQLGYPSEITRSDNPFPAGFIDLSSIVSFALDINVATVHPNFAIRVVIRDANYGWVDDTRNYDIATRHINIPASEFFRGNTIDRTRVTYVGIDVTVPAFTITRMLFTTACNAATNVNAAAAAPIPFVLGSPASFSIHTCGNCVAGDFTGGFEGLERDNVFWFSVPQQSAAFVATFSSETFVGYDDAYLWVFDGEGTLLAFLDNLASQAFEVSVDVREFQIFVAVGAACYIESFTLDVSFSATNLPVVDTATLLQLATMEDNLSSLVNTGFSGLSPQLNGVSGQLTASSSSIIAAISQAKADLQGFIASKTDRIDGEIATLSLSVNAARQSLSDHTDVKFTQLDASLNSRFGTVGTTLNSMADLIDDHCGSAEFGVVSLSAFLNAQWTNRRNQQIIEKFITGALIPAHFQTPRSQGGALDDIFSFLQNTVFTSKKSLADAGKSGPTACKSGEDGAYCTFFYKFPTGDTGAQKNYQTAITAYYTAVAQARYAQAFQALSTAYNALFMGQI